MSKIRIRLTSDGTPHGTHFTDTTTGATLDVLKASLDWRPERLLTATITVLISDLDVTGEMDVDEVRLSDLRQQQEDEATWEAEFQEHNAAARAQDTADRRDAALRRRSPLVLSVGPQVDDSSRFATLVSTALDDYARGDIPPAAAHPLLPGRRA